MISHRGHRDHREISKKTNKIKKKAKLATKCLPKIQDFAAE
jgi:hypothetical protein